MEHLEQANKLLYTIKQEAEVPLRIHAFPESEELVMVGWCDASSQNRHEGYSTEGTLIGMARHTRGILVTDSRNVYDKVDNPYASPKGVDIELLALNESQESTCLSVRWVNSDAQLANILTKRGEEHQITRFISLGQQWRIVHDPDMFSGKKRRAQGKDPLENGGGGS